MAMEGEALSAYWGARTGNGDCSSVFGDSLDWDTVERRRDGGADGEGGMAMGSMGRADNMAVRRRASRRRWERDDTAVGSGGVTQHS